jgi:hypothetical protein
MDEYEFVMRVREQEGRNGVNSYYFVYLWTEAWNHDTLGLAHYDEYVSGFDRGLNALR